jgi:predicted HTH domain antitoxin
MKVVSVRLDQKEIEMIEKLARAQRKDKSAVTRELIDYGWYFLALKNYKDGKVSLGNLAKQLDLSLAETMDLLAEFGVTAPINYADYLKGYEPLSKK